MQCVRNPNSKVKLCYNRREETERKDRKDDETNYLIKALQYKVSKPGFFYPCRDNPLPANWGVSCLMSEERRAKRCETKRRGLTKKSETKASRAPRGDYPFCPISFSL